MFFSLQKLWRFNIKKLVGAAVKKACKKEERKQEYTYITIIETFLPGFKVTIFHPHDKNNNNTFTIAITTLSRYEFTSSLR